MTRTSRTVRTYRYIGPDGKELKRVETTVKTIHDDGTEKTEVHVSEDAGFPADSRPPGSLPPTNNPAAVTNGSGGYSQRIPSDNPRSNMSDRNIKLRGGQPVAERRGAKSGWGQRESVVKPSIAVQGKNYDDIRKQCLDRGGLWEDAEFPAVDASIFYSRAPNKKFEWKRPGEICDNPQLFVESASRFDVQQGELGDCWLLAAVASLTCNQKLLYKIISPDQTFGSGYAGIFKFSFWQYGEWVDVVIDDRLPTYYNRLVFLHSGENNEFWSALLEKAYAKLNGSYEALKGGSQAEAMEDFTGGLTERFDLQKAPSNLLQIMLKGMQRGSLFGCALDAGGQIEGKGPLGLITGHAYSVTAVRMCDIKTMRSQGKIPLIRVRNPWGNEAEWEGPWSDKSREWSLISDAEKQEMELKTEDDGEFWMAFQDFCKYFTTLEMCSLGPDSMAGEDSTNRWEAKQELGQWLKRVNAGGCRNFLDTFWSNPQYRLTVTDPDDDDEDDLCTVIVGLMQKDRRKKREQGLDMLTIGYVIYQVKDAASQSSGQLDLNFFKYNASFAKSPTFINTREVCGRHQLPPGTYVIVPSTFGPNEEADFLVRLFSEKTAEAAAADEETGYDENARNVRVPPSDPSVVAKLRATFERISGADLEIDAYELREILNAAYGKEFEFDGFSLETCRSMVAMMDIDRSGKLGFDEFRVLWDCLREWKGVFKKYDSDKSGTFSSYELRQALNKLGFKLSNGTFKCMVMRFANQQGLIEFDDFVLCSVRLKSLYDLFESSKEGGSATFGMDEFIQNGLYS